MRFLRLPPCFLFFRSPSPRASYHLAWLVADLPEVARSSFAWQVVALNRARNLTFSRDPKEVTPKLEMFGTNPRSCGSSRLGTPALEPLPRIARSSLGAAYLLGTISFIEMQGHPISMVYLEKVEGASKVGIKLCTALGSRTYLS